MTLAAEAPDLDVVGRFGGSAFGFAHHRGFTHSFLGGLLVAAVVVGFVDCVDWVRGRGSARVLPDGLPPPRWGLLFVFAYIACLSHILLDFTNNYGVRPFWPFSGRWYSWDIVFIVEPVLLVFLIGGLVAPLFTRLIDEEIGERKHRLPGTLAARVALFGVLLTWGIRDYGHRRAVAALEARLYQNETPLRASAFPHAGNPFSWFGVVDTPRFYASMNVDSWTPEADPEGNLHIFYKPEETAVTAAARNTYTGRAFYGWAQYPASETEKLTDSGGYRVRLFDLRFGDPQVRLMMRGAGGRHPLGFDVELDSQLREVPAKP